MDLPDDPSMESFKRFEGVEHPDWDGWPKWQEYTLQGVQVTHALSDVASYAGMRAMIEAAPREDLEKALAQFLCVSVCNGIVKASQDTGLSDQEANNKWIEWLAGPMTDEPMSEFGNLG